MTKERTRMIENPSVTRTLQRSLRRGTCMRTRLVPAVVALIGISTTGLPVELQSHWLSSPVMAQTSAESTGLPDFADIVERVKPAVAGVNVQIEVGTTGRAQRRLPGQQDSPFSGSPGETPSVPRSVPRSVPPSVPRSPTSVGSAFFISADGYLITTNHVIEHAKSIEITTDDNKTHAAKLVGADAKSDLALLKVDGEGQFPF